MRHARGILRACRPLCGRAGAAADPFAVLGLPRTASQAEIRERYLHLAKQTHPDVAAPSEPVAPFADLSAAYQALTAVEAETEAREQRAQLRAEVDALVKASRIGDALGVFSTLCALPCALPPGPAEERQLRATARSLLEACAQRGELTRHAQSAEVWRWIEERDAVVSRPPSERTPPRRACTSSTEAVHSARARTGPHAPRGFRSACVRGTRATRSRPIASPRAEGSRRARTCWRRCGRLSTGSGPRRAKGMRAAPGTWTRARVMVDSAR